MLALWMYQWDEAEWTAASPAPAPAPAAEASRSNAGGGKRRNDYVGPSPDFWEVRERYLRRYEKVIERTQVIAKSNFPAQETSDNLSGDRAGGQPPATTDLQAVLELMRFELEVARAKAQHAKNATELQEAMRAAVTLALDIRKIEQQYYDRAISVLLLDVF